MAKDKPRKKTSRSSRGAEAKMSHPTTTGLRWFAGSAQRLGTITQAWFTDEGILRLEIECDYTDVSHYSIVLNYQSPTNPLEYSGTLLSNAGGTGEVTAKLTESGKHTFLLTGTWSELGESWDWESTGDIVIASRA